jgi:hypothetical protein
MEMDAQRTGLEVQRSLKSRGTMQDTHRLFHRPGTFTALLRGTVFSLVYSHAATSRGSAR